MIHRREFKDKLAKELLKIVRFNKLKKTPNFQNEARCPTFIYISKVKYLTSFRYRGPGELGNGLLDSDGTSSDIGEA